MTYSVTPESIQNVRYEVQDIELGLYILPDATYEYILTKNEGSIARSSIDAARMILMRLAISSKDQVVDIITLRGSKTVESYRQALLLFISNPSLNPLLNNASGWAGGVSLSEMRANNSTADNNINPLSVTDKYPRTTDDTVDTYNPFVAV